MLHHFERMCIPITYVQDNKIIVLLHCWYVVMMNGNSSSFSSKIKQIKQQK